MKLIFIHYSVLLELFADIVCKVYLFYGRLIRLKKIDFFTKFSILKFSFLVFVYISYFSTKFITINLLIFGLNTGKYGPQTTPYLSTFDAVFFLSDTN